MKSLRLGILVTKLTPNLFVKSDLSENQEMSDLGLSDPLPTSQWPFTYIEIKKAI